MTREWQPGDVAMLEVGTPSERIGLRARANNGWRTPAGHMSDATTPPGAEHRPLVVIDPEDREACRRLALAYNTSRGESGTDRMQDGLRAFANPTPTEPTDPKARVTDRRENVWRLLADGDWVCTDGPDIGEYLVWWQLAERGPLTVEGVAR